jgi:hypothetical protein
VFPHDRIRMGDGLLMIASRALISI